MKLDCYLHLNTKTETITVEYVRCIYNFLFKSILGHNNYIHSYFNYNDKDKFIIFIFLFK